MPTAWLMGRPALAGEKAIGDTRVENVGQDGVGPLDARDFIEGLKRRVEGRQLRPASRERVGHGEETWKSQRLIEVQPASVCLPKAMAARAPKQGFRKPCFGARAAIAF